MARTGERGYQGGGYTRAPQSPPKWVESITSDWGDRSPSDPYVVSERRACSAFGADRTSVRYRSYRAEAPYPVDGKEFECASLGVDDRGQLERLVGLRRERARSFVINTNGISNFSPTKY